MGASLLSLLSSFFTLPRSLHSLLLPPLLRIGRAGLLLLLLLLISQSCTQYPGYTKHSDSIYYQRVQLGEGILYHPDSCFLDYSISYAPLNKPNQVAQKHIKFSQISPAILNDGILKNLQKGELIKLIVKDSSIYINELCLEERSYTNESIKITFKVDAIYNLYLQEEDPNVLEYKSIKTFMSYISSPNLYKHIEGIWLKTINRNDSIDRAIQGEIVLDYKGFSLQDDSLDIPDYPLQFNVSDQYQVIKGIEIALQNMHFGDSVMVIIPSYLAFGELGSKNGNVPPYTALKYFLKVYTPSSYQTIYNTEN